MNLSRCISIQSIPFVIQVRLHSVAAVEADFQKSEAVQLFTAQSAF